MNQHGTISVTFCDQGENHVGMQKIGKLSESGYSQEQMNQFQERFQTKGFETEMIILSNVQDLPYASILIVKNLISKEENKINFDQLRQLDWDKKAKMYGRVVNKSARYNLCIADFDQEPNYEESKGRIYKWDTPQISELSRIHSTLCQLDPELLIAELNYYYDTSKCGIGFHGDSERRRVVCLRLGEPLSLKYKWYHYGKPTNIEHRFTINGGDLYIMSEKAVGFDWKRNSIQWTLRHAAGKHAD
jgi:hypothetical protein